MPNTIGPEESARHYSVHPMCKAVVRCLLAEDRADWNLIETLLVKGALRAMEYAGERFYLWPVDVRVMC